MPNKAPPLDLAIRTEDCGCKVMSTIDEELWIEFCSLHEAAAGLLAACEALCSLCISSGLVEPEDMTLLKAQAITARAKGDTCD